MKKIIVSMHVSLDGYAGGPHGELDWINHDEPMFELVKVFTDNADTAIYGRVTWQLMDAYWPTAADQPAATKHDKEHSHWYMSVDKFVISNSMAGHAKDRTTFVGGEVIAAIQDLKEQDGKDIVMFGSPSIVRLLMTENMIDEYWLFVNSVILGNGIPLFGKTPEPIHLQLMEMKVFPCQVVGLHYAKK